MIRPWPWEKTTLSIINSTNARIDSTELVIQSSFNPRTANLPTNQKNESKPKIWETYKPP